MLASVGAAGRLTAILCHAAPAKTVDPDKGSSSVQAMSALNAIVAYLLSHGVASVSIRETGSRISWYLDADGSSDLKG